MEDTPNIVVSGKSQALVVDGHRFEVEIYRLEKQAFWTLEVIDERGTSHVWDDEFGTDVEALTVAITALDEEGAAGFLSDGKVIPFPSR